MNDVNRMNGVVVQDLPPDVEQAINSHRKSFAGVDAADLEQFENEPVDWLVEGVFASDQLSVFGARSKGMKTSQLCDLAVSLATGEPWLNHFKIPRKRKVLFITGEASDRAISRRIGKCLRAKGLTWADVNGRLRVEARNFPLLPSPADQVAIAQDVAEHGFGAVLLDPLYRGLSGIDSNKLNEVGPAIVDFAGQCNPASFVMSHHIIKAAARTNEPPTLEDMSGAGLAESCGNWWLGCRNSEYQYDGQHDLGIVYGGRDEQAGALRINFDERAWKWTVSSLSDLKREREKDREQRKQDQLEGQVREAKARISHVLANEGQFRSKQWIEDRARSAGPQRIIRAAMADMLSTLSLIEGEYTDARNRRQTGIGLPRLTPSSDGGGEMLVDARQCSSNEEQPASPDVGEIDARQRPKGARRPSSHPGKKRTSKKTTNKRTTVTSIAKREKT
jgi:AAA domain